MSQLKPSIFFLIFFILISVPLAHGAGQVVTNEAREWARQAVAEERSFSAAPPRNTLAVLYFVNRTGRAELDPLQKGMTLMLLSDLSQAPGLQLVERVRLQALTEELGMGRSGLVEQATAPRVGKLLGARWVTGGDFAGSRKETFDTRLRLVDVQTSLSAGQYSVEGVLDDILKTEKELVFKLVEQLKISLTPDAEAAIRKPCSTNPQALDSLFQGVDASDRGDYQRAGNLYNKAIKADPLVCVASEALDELERMGLYQTVLKGGSIAPTSRGPVKYGSTTTYIVKTEPGFSAKVTGCGGTLKGNIYTTGPLTGPCKVKVTFNIIQYTVTTAAGANGSITPASRQVDHGAATTFTVTPKSGYNASVTGCGGALKGNTYLTGPITADCMINATFDNAPPPGNPAP